MITDKKGLKEYLEADRVALGRVGGVSPFDLIWRFEKALRYSEFFQNKRKKLVFDKACDLFWRWQKWRLGIKCGFTIPNNVVGKGLSIVHIGTVVISRYAKLGDGCRIHVGVNIGVAAGTLDAAPKLGNRIYIGPGAKIFGRINIADDVAIGANAVVCKDVLEENSTVVGVPARVISHKGSKGLI